MCVLCPVCRAQEMSSPLPEAETEVKEEETAELQRASTPKVGVQT